MNLHLNALRLCTHDLSLLLLVRCFECCSKQVFLVKIALNELLFVDLSPA